MKHLVIMLFLLGLASPAFAQQTHYPVPSTNLSFMSDLQTFLKNEDAARHADLFSGSVISGGTHGAGGGLTQAPTSLVAYPGGYYITDSGSIVYPNNATCWVIAGSDTTSIINGFVRAGSTHYLLNCGAANQPAQPTNTVYLMKVVTLNGSISTVTDLRQRTPMTTMLSVGPVGLRLGIADGTEAGWTSNPAAIDWVTLYPYISSSSGRNRIWSINPIVDVLAGSEATAWISEFDMNVGTVNAPDPRNTNHKVGIDVVSGGTFAPSAAFLTNGTTLANRWKHGIWFDYVGGQTGSTLIKANTNINVDFGLDLSLATINFQGVRVGSTPVGQIAPLAVRQFANNQVGFFLQRFTDTSPTGNIFQLTNAANTVVLAQFDALGNLTLPAANANVSNLLVTSAAATVTTGQIGIGSTHATTVGAAGGASALPATPLGYAIWNVEGTQVKVPYYPN